MSHRYDPCVLCPLPAVVSSEVSCSTCVRVYLGKVISGTDIHEGRAAVHWAALQALLHRIGRGRHVRARLGSVP